jgi:hypothetical protein
MNAGILYFEHVDNSLHISESLRDAITRYELHLRYYNQGLRRTGFPYAFHTLGSAFFVKAMAYVKQGGMIKRKAGEDFYFLNKIFRLGKVREVNSTAVYPSPRISDRVIFGTGMEIKRILDDPPKPYLTYHQNAFSILGEFFAEIDNLFYFKDNDIKNYVSKQPERLRQFLESERFQFTVKRIRKYCRQPKIFKNHFFQWFNGLKIIRFMHFIHEHELERQPVEKAAAGLLKDIHPGHRSRGAMTGDVFQLLGIYRKIERSSGYTID